MALELLLLLLLRPKLDINLWDNCRSGNKVAVLIRSIICASDGSFMVNLVELAVNLVA
jgi:hypothetical protein